MEIIYCVKINKQYYINRDMSNVKLSHPYISILQIHIQTEYYDRKVNMIRVMRKPAFSICENKGTDQLCGNHTADQRLCFYYIDSTNFLNRKFQASSYFLWLYSLVCV